MKVYCRDCYYIWSHCETPFDKSCMAPDNLDWNHYETWYSPLPNKRKPFQLIDSSGFIGEYLKKIQRPQEINYNNQCKWFEERKGHK